MTVVKSAEKVTQLEKNIKGKEKQIRRLNEDIKKKDDEIESLNNDLRYSAIEVLENSIQDKDNEIKRLVNMCVKPYECIDSEIITEHVTSQTITYLNILHQILTVSGRISLEDFFQAFGKVQDKLQKFEPLLETCK